MAEQSCFPPMPCEKERKKEAEEKKLSGNGLKNSVQGEDQGKLRESVKGMKPQRRTVQENVINTVPGTGETAGSRWKGTQRESKNPSGGLLCTDLSYRLHPQNDPWDDALEKIGQGGCEGQP